MARFTVEMDTDNAAFSDDNRNAETASILRDMADSIEHGATSGTVLDSNGNAVGRYRFSDPSMMIACAVCGCGFDPADPQRHRIITGHQADAVQRR